MFDVFSDHSCSRPAVLPIIRAICPRDSTSRHTGDWVYRFIYTVDHYTGDDNVYFIGAQSTNLLKIGRSVSPHRRLAQLQLLSPVALSILGVMRGGSEIEALLHEQFLELRSHGEWFHGTKPLLDFIGVVCSPDCWKMESAA